MKNSKQINYSIIIPIYNNTLYIEECIESIIVQKSCDYSIEIIIIDDCSTDSTLELLKSIQKKYTSIKILSTKINSGPGIARNIGINHATGEWVLFLDSDDKLHPSAFKILTEQIKSHSSYDVFTYNWSYDKVSTAQANKGGGRFDFYSFKKAKEELLHDYLSLGMDGSVIYTLISSKLLKKNNILFHEGFHEDVDFILKIYYLAHKIQVVDNVLYLKNNRKDSIVNSISTKHIEGFFRAFEEIYKFLDKMNNLTNKNFYFIYIGIVGIVASRVREIWHHTNTNEDKLQLYNTVYTEFQKYISKYLNNIKIPSLETRFFKIFYYFQKQIENKNNNLIENMDKFLSDIIKKSWSCYDIHNSLFLAPNEIRVCCKRFFDEGKMKGDVVLLQDNFEIKNILKAKKDLYTSINKGQSDECRNCPFLEFKEWGYIDNLNIEHLSLEYHSICNMKCTYCSDKYYGGVSPKYNVIQLFEELKDNNSFQNIKSVVWGGGEPTLDKNFSSLLNTTVETFPNIKQRIITNATVFKNDVYKFINDDKLTITTSIDAGTAETFYKIRKNKDFEKVLNTLNKYSEQKPENITIKYIIMDENKNLDELKTFVNTIKKYNLQHCNFQISFDFKKDVIDVNTYFSILILYALLNDIEAHFIFFDDLLLQRLKNITSEEYKLVSQKLYNLGYESLLINNDRYESIVIWGAGHQTKQLFETSIVLKELSIAYIVDNDLSKINTKYLGYDVYDPQVLLNDNYPIYISAVQNTPKIIEQYKKLNINEDRLLKGLLL